MYCMQCKQDVAIDSAFCAQCGSKTVSEPEARAVSVLLQPPTWKSGLIIVAVLALAFSAIAYLKRNEYKKFSVPETGRLAAIQQVQSRFLPLSSSILGRADIESSRWLAEEIDNDTCQERFQCYAVVYSVNIMEGSETKTVDCEFIVAFGEYKTVAIPRNTAARTLFRHK